jgi:peptidoglycan/LPS O-acetylase OafA/YrhL
MRFTVLDAWRGVAALMIALFRLHADGWFHDAPVVRNAYLFVDFFFVLSGFVIAHAYLTRIEDGRAAGVFMVRRFGRVWPLHAALLAVFVAMEAARFLAPEVDRPPFTGTRTPDTIVANIFLVQALGFYEHLSWNVPSWSISTEFWTYALFAAICLAGRRAVPVVAGILALASLAVVAGWSTNGMDVTADYGIFRCIAGFFAGLLVHRLWGATRTLRFGVLATPVELGAVALAVAFVSLAGTGPASFAAPLVFAAVVWVFAFEAGAVSRLLMGRLPQALGAWSYSIYMTALLVAYGFTKVVAAAGRTLGVPLVGTGTVDGQPVAMIDFGPPGAMDLLALVYVALVCLVSWATYRRIEEPGRAFFNRLADRLGAKRPAPAPAPVPVEPVRRAA